MFQLKKELIEILACPIDKSYPLSLRSFKETGEEILEGIISCKKCGRVFPVIRGIPILLPDEMRSKSLEAEFEERWRHLLNKA